MRIIGKTSSFNVRKVLWACEEIGIAYTCAHDGPELLQNPNGLVPVLVDGSFVLRESCKSLRSARCFRNARRHEGQGFG